MGLSTGFLIYLVPGNGYIHGHLQTVFYSSLLKMTKCQFLKETSELPHTILRAFTYHGIVIVIPVALSKSQMGKIFSFTNVSVFRNDARNVIDNQSKTLKAS